MEAGKNTSINEDESKTAIETQKKLHGQGDQRSEHVEAAQRRFSEMKKAYKPLEKTQLELLFTEARTQYSWHTTPVNDELLGDIYNLTKMGSTSVNCCPARFIFIRTEEGRERIKPSLTGNNIEKVMTAPVTTIIAYDVTFFERLDQLVPYMDLKPMFAGKGTFSEVTAFRNGTLQGAYFMMAAKALGLDCGPISGFDNSAVDDEFFMGTSVKSNFLCCLGYGDSKRLFQRLPRFDFEEVCTLL